MVYLEKEKPTEVGSNLSLPTTFLGDVYATETCGNSVSGLSIISIYLGNVGDTYFSNK